VVKALRDITVQTSAVTVVEECDAKQEASKAEAEKRARPKCIRVLFGSQTGNAMELAKRIYAQVLYTYILFHIMAPDFFLVFLFIYLF
jgi:sulfite reductase alpha subunit-like flavoprotein